MGKVGLTKGQNNLSLDVNHKIRLPYSFTDCT